MQTLLSRLMVALLGVAILIPSVGCGFINGSGHGDLLLASEDEGDFELGKNRRQLSIQTAKVLPKPEFGVTPEVQAELDRFMGRDRATVERVLNHNPEKVEKMQAVFREEGIPTELLSVAAVESGLNPAAHSPAGARGLWQLMRATARVYGLKVTSKHDERLDPDRSTEAAAKLLRDLFVQFNDWHLALAAYNAGGGAVSRVMARSNESNFWELARAGKLPGETRRFVPRVIALSLIVNDPSRYGFGATKLVG